MNYSSTEELLEALDLLEPAHQKVVFSTIDALLKKQLGPNYNVDWDKPRECYCLGCESLNISTEGTIEWSKNDQCFDVISPADDWSCRDCGETFAEPIWRNIELDEEQEKPSDETQPTD